MAVRNLHSFSSRRIPSFIAQYEHIVILLISQLMPRPVIITMLYKSFFFAPPSSCHEKNLHCKFKLRHALMKARDLFILNRSCTYIFLSINFIKKIQCICSYRSFIFDGIDLEKKIGNIFPLEGEIFNIPHKTRLT